MYCGVLTVNRWPPPWYAFPCMLLQILSSDDQIRPKYVRDEKWMRSVLRVVFCL